MSGEELRVIGSRPGARCPFCHDSLGQAARERCPGCSADHHLECWDEHGGCSACGLCVPLFLEQEPPDAEPAPACVPVRAWHRRRSSTIAWGGAPTQLRRCWAFRVFAGLALLALIALGFRGQDPSQAALLSILAGLVALFLKLASDDRVEVDHSGRVVIDHAGLRRFGVAIVGWRLALRLDRGELEASAMEPRREGARVFLGPVELARLPDAASARGLLDALRAALVRLPAPSHTKPAKQ